jgi:general secretion pathway protein C
MSCVLTVDCKNFNHNPAMSYPSANRMGLHVATLFVWLLAVGSAVYWVLHIDTVRSGSHVAAVAIAKVELPDPAGMAQLLGATASPSFAPVNASSRFTLQGVVSGARGKEAALIVIDDKPAQAFRVGSTIEDGLILQSATARQVTISATPLGPALMTLEMPPLVK